MPQPTDEKVAETIAEAAESLIFARFKQSCVKDFDVTMTSEDGVLDVDAYVNAPGDADDADDAEVVAGEAVLTAQEAVDELLVAADKK